MKKYIVLSVNDNPDYLFFTPLTCWAWRKFGWEPIMFFNGELTDLVKHYLYPDGRTTEAFAVNISGYRSDTITQVSRLYAACILNEQAYLMTGDIDLIPLSNYWKFNENEITVWGHDLTSFTHYPICFIGMPVHLWVDVMKLSSQDYNAMILRDLNSIPNARADAQWEKRWFVDQDLITERLNGFHKEIINRGQLSNGYAKGRIDRGAWNINQPELIDCHMFQQLYFKQNENKFEMTMELLHKVWPKEDFTWFRTYTKEYQKLTGHA